MFFNKNHVKIEKVKIPKMTKYSFQLTLYPEANVCVTLICHYFVAFRAYYTH